MSDAPAALTGALLCALGGLGACTTLPAPRLSRANFYWHGCALIKVTTLHKARLGILFHIVSHPRKLSCGLALTESISRLAMARSKPSKQANKRTTTTTSASRNASVSLPSSTPADDTQDDFANMSTSSSSAIEDSILESHEEEEDGADVDTPTGARSRSPAPRDITLEDEDEEILTSGSKPSQSNVVVCVRVRPASPSATSTSDPWKLSQESSTIEATENHPSLAKRAPSSAPGLAASSSSSFLADKPQATASGEKDAYKYTFDSILPPTSSDLSALYKAHISPVVCGAVQGYNGTVFAYGQTGSGKTYTMSGGGSDPGIIGRAINEVFECVGRDPSREFLLRVSYLEIYNETLRDLLASLPSSSSVAEGLQPSASSSSTVGNRPASPTKGGYSHQAGGGSALRIQEHPASGRITISGLREEVVTSSADITSLLERGQAARHQAATDWNERSSRSHCVATLTIESRRKEGADGVRVSALNLIDLAGSERAASEKERRKEGAFVSHDRSGCMEANAIADIPQNPFADQQVVVDARFRHFKVVHSSKQSCSCSTRPIS